MAARFNTLRDKVRDWSNRDLEALPNSIIEDTMMWAADKAYRTLRVPPLENTILYYPEGNAEGNTPVYMSENNNNIISSLTRFPIPGDLIEFIHIRSVDEDGQTIRVFNEKADVRTFRDTYAEKYVDFAYWTRQGGDVLLAPSIGFTGSGGSLNLGSERNIELYYYRRLPSLDARYDVTLANYNLGLLETATGVILPAPSPAATSITEIPSGAVGQEVPNWLRDENERIVIFGALAESFAYLQENEEAQKYMAMFQREIAELNDEDVRRNASGGNVQVNFNGRGLI